MKQDSVSPSSPTPVEQVRRMASAMAWAGRPSLPWRSGAGVGSYEQAVSDLRGEVASLTDLDPSDCDTTHLWTRCRRDVRWRLLSRDPERFLTWTPIVRSMTFGVLPWIGAELRALRACDDWQTRWRPVLIENRAGAPMPCHVYPRSSGTLVHHAYHVHRFERNAGMPVASFKRIVEFGGGYGSMARLIGRLGFSGQYHIHDLPEFIALQRFYLRAVRAEVGRGPLADTLCRVTGDDHPDAEALLATAGPDALLIATWSLSETPLQVREAWRTLLDRFQYFLIGFHDQFENINNRRWFDLLVRSRPDVEWRFESASHRPDGCRYLFGIPRRGGTQPS